MDDREEAIDILTRMSTNHFYGHREQEALKLGAEALSAERRGHWIIDKEFSNIGGCSICGDRWGSVDQMHYCPSCGAMMKGEQNG